MREGDICRSSEKMEMKYVQGIWCGSFEYLKTLKVRDERKLTSIPNKKHIQSALKKLEMGECKESVSPKLDKACIDGDSGNLMRNRRPGSDPQCLLFCISAAREQTFKARYGCCVRS